MAQAGICHCGLGLQLQLAIASVYKLPAQEWVAVGRPAAGVRPSARQGVSPGMLGERALPGVVPRAWTAGTPGAYCGGGALASLADCDSSRVASTSSAVKCRSCSCMSGRLLASSLSLEVPLHTTIGHDGFSHNCVKTQALLTCKMKWEVPVHLPGAPAHVCRAERARQGAARQDCQIAQPH